MKALLVLVLLAGVAHADKDADYERALKRGDAAWARGDWTAAREAYEEAYTIDPRPIAAVNMASAFYKEGDLVNARRWYVEFLRIADGEEFEGDRTVARGRIEEIDVALAKPKPPPVLPPPTIPELRRPYPRELIRRPLTQPPGLFSAATGLAITTYDAADDNGEVVTYARPIMLLGATYGITSRFEAGGEVAAAFDDASRGTAFGVATAMVAEGIAVRGTIAIGFGGTFEARMGAPLRVRVTPRLAIVALEDHVVVDTEREVFLRLPLGVGVQLARPVYVAASVRLVDAALRERDAAFATAGIATVAITPIRAVDIVVGVMVSEERTEASTFVRMRI